MTPEFLECGRRRIDHCVCLKILSIYGLAIFQVLIFKRAIHLQKRKEKEKEREGGKRKNSLAELKGCFLLSVLVD